MAMITDHNLLAQQQMAELEEEHKRMQMEAMIAQAMSPKPFDETEEFRDYVVWLCGFTEHKAPPSQEDWDDLRERTKKIAAKFALAAKDRARDALRERTYPSYQPYPNTWTTASAGDATTFTTSALTAASGVAYVRAK